jgi:hypothetical protein
MWFKSTKNVLNIKLIFEQNNFILQTLPDQIYIMDLQGHLNGKPPCPFAKMTKGFYTVWPFIVDSSVCDKMLVNTEVLVM